MNSRRTNIRADLAHHDVVTIVTGLVVRGGELVRLARRSAVPARPRPPALFRLVRPSTSERFVLTAMTDECSGFRH